MKLIITITSTMETNRKDWGYNQGNQISNEQIINVIRDGDFDLIEHISYSEITITDVKIED